MGSLVAAVTSDGPVGVIVAGVVVAMVAGEVFWLLALGQPSRQLRWVLRHSSSAAEAERWMRLLAAARRDVLEARERRCQPPTTPRQ
jgi:hypothetical protein